MFEHAVPDSYIAVPMQDPRSAVGSQEGHTVSLQESKRRGPAHTHTTKLNRGERNVSGHFFVLSSACGRPKIVLSTAPEHRTTTDDGDNATSSS